MSPGLGPRLVHEQRPGEVRALALPVHRQVEADDRVLSARPEARPNDEVGLARLQDAGRLFVGSKCQPLAGGTSVWRNERLVDNVRR